MQAYEKINQLAWLSLTAICLIFCPLVLFSQPGQVRFEHLSVDQGLSQSTGTAIVQDSQGFIWFGTQDGLNKYDGINFKIYRHDPADSTSLSRNFVAALCADKFGSIWIATERGRIDRLDVGQEIFYHYESQNESSELAVRSIYEDRSGTIWLATSAGLRKFVRDKNRFKSFLIDSVNLDLNWITAIHEDGFGTLWVGNAVGRVYTFDRDQHVFEPVEIPAPQDGELQIEFISSIYVDSAEYIWLGSFPHGLLRYDRVSRRCKGFPSDLANRKSPSSNSISVIAEDKAQNLWVGTEGGGLNRFNRAQGTFTRFRHDPLDSKSLSNDEVISLLVDNAGALWVGTGGSGINKFDPEKEKFQHLENSLSQPNALRGNFVWSILEDSAGFLWIGTQSGGLNRFDRNRGIFKVFENSASKQYSLNSKSVLSICEDGAGTIWVGTSNGLDRLDREAGTFRRYSAETHNLRSNWIRTLYLDRNGLLWIGTGGGGLTRLDTKTRQFVSYHDSESTRGLGNSTVTSIIEDSEGRLWVGTIRDGLSRLERTNKAFTRFLHDPADPNSLSSDYVMAINVDSSGKLWLGTFYGLNRFDPETGAFRVYTTKDGLPNDVVYGVLSDDKGNLWLSTNKGLARFDPRTEKFKNYDLADGLQSREFNSGAYSKSASGEMFFGGVNGLNIFHPDSVHDNPNIPPIVITGMRKFDQPVDIPSSGSANLSYRDSFISIEFAALNYTNPEKNQFAYKLEGFNDEWIYCGNQRYATFTNLDPGKYLFRVRGSNNDGIWNEEGAALRILVAPPFWQTSWFVVLGLLTGIAGLALLIIYFRHRARQKAELDRKIAELKLQALRAKMNPHFVFNTINSIQYFISSDEQKAAYRYLSKFSKLMRKTLENAEQSSLSISDELECLKLYLELESLRFEGKFDYKLEVDSKIDLQETSIPTLLIQPFVENAIHHGLQFKRSKGRLSINLALENGSIVCTIQDNGIGIDRSLKMASKNNGEHRPIGLKITQERLETLNALRKNGRGIEISDLSRQDEGLQGTRVKIVIPVDA